MQRTRTEPPPFQEVADRLIYEPHSGLIRARVANSRRPAGAEAGTLAADGYRYVSVGGRRLAAHRVAILLSTGFWPDGEVDHVNGNPSDNRLQNLRVVGRVTNCQNRRRPQSNNRSSGILGVTWNKRAGKWQAQIQDSDKHRYLGVFQTAEEAAAAYLSAKRELHAGCTI